MLLSVLLFREDLALEDTDLVLNYGQRLVFLFFSIHTFLVDLLGQIRNILVEGFQGGLLGTLKFIHFCGNLNLNIILQSLHLSLHFLFNHLPLFHLIFNYRLHF